MCVVPTLEGGWAVLYYNLGAVGVGKGGGKLVYVDLSWSMVWCLASFMRLWY